jgi:hypothetical protein
MKNEKLDKCFNTLKKNDELINVNNLMVQSLFYSGGTLTEKECIEYLENLINIGFCQPKFYKAAVWKKANHLMMQLCKGGKVQPFDFGRGKGKYNSNSEMKDIIKELL